MVHTNYMVMTRKQKYITFNITQNSFFAEALKYYSMNCNLNKCTCLSIEQLNLGLSQIFGLVC